MKIHKKDLRLRVNAGVDFPMCYANTNALLDFDKCKLQMTSNILEVTCKRCLRLCTSKKK